MTSRRVRAFFWILFLFLIQSMISFIFTAWTPPLILIGVIFYALIEGPLFGAVIGCFAGFLMDILGVGKLGGSMAIVSSLGVLAGFSASKIFYDSFFTQIFLPALGNYLLCFFSLLFFKNLPQAEGFSLDLFKESLLLCQPLLTVAASPVVFMFLKKVVRKN